MDATPSKPVQKSAEAGADATVAATPSTAQKPVRRGGRPPRGAARRPAWLPAEFESPEALVSAYYELLSERAGGKIGGPRSAKPVDFEMFEREYYETGALSDDAYGALESSGLPRALVDRYIEGQRALSDKLRREILDEVGGEDGFAALKAWAEASLDPEALQAYEAAMRGGVDQARLAIRGMQLAYERAQGRPPQLVSGGARGPGGGERFANLQELADAMSDPRYMRDEAYRQSIQSKLSRSKLR